ncbi:MAG: hypothetical protein NTY46_01960 [Candidatus Sumerlaeota bacterium]|nr:hypothetical protein [Candidatus Sumerlaeota bacterium]
MSMIILHRLKGPFAIAALWTISALPCAQPGAVSANFMIPWGSESGQLGLVNQPEQERAGPLTFTVSAPGTILAADTVNNAVKEFSSGGVEGYGQEVFTEDGFIGVNDPDQVAYLFDQSDGNPAMPAATAHGRRMPDCDRACTAVTSVSASIRLLPKGLTPNTVYGAGRSLFFPSLSPAHRLGSVLYRGATPDGKFFVEIENIPSGGGGVQLDVERRMWPPTRAAQVKLNNDYFTTVYTKSHVLPDGTIWQMLTTDKGVIFSHLTFGGNT